MNTKITRPVWGSTANDDVAQPHTYPDKYLEASDRLDDFLESYPTVSRNHAIEVLERAKTVLVGKSDEIVD